MTSRSSPPSGWPDAATLCSPHGPQRDGEAAIGAQSKRQLHHDSRTHSTAHRLPRGTHTNCQHPPRHERPANQNDQGSVLNHQPIALQWFLFCIETLSWNPECYFYWCHAERLHSPSCGGQIRKGGRGSAAFRKRSQSKCCRQSMHWYAFIEYYSL